MCLFGSKPGKSRRLGSVSKEAARSTFIFIFFICALGNNRKEPRSDDLGPAIIC